MKHFKRFLKEKGIGFYDPSEMENNIWKVGPVQNSNVESKVPNFIAKFDYEAEAAKIVYSGKVKYDDKEKQILRTLFMQKMPKDLRKSYWMNASGATREMENNPQYYERILKNFPDYIPSSYISIIKSDLERTFPTEAFFQKKENLNKMYNILLAFTRRNPSIGYCQGFNFIVGRILEIINDEEKAFWLFVQVVETIIPIEHYIEVAGVMADIPIILPFIKEIVPEVSAHLSKLEFEISLNNLLYKWLVSLFTQGMNEEIWLPLWDLLFIEGYIVIFKAAIVVILLAKDTIINLDDMMKLTTFFEEDIVNFTHPKYVDYLLNKEFPFLNMEYIIGKRDHNLKKVTEEIKRSYESKRKTSLDRTDVTDRGDLDCNLDWPICVESLKNTNIYHAISISVMQPYNIKQDYYNLNVDLYKLSRDMNTVRRKFEIDINNMQDEKKKNIILFSNLLIERHKHICNCKVSTKREIFGKIDSNNHIVIEGKKIDKSMEAFSTFISGKKNMNYSKIIDSVDKSNFEMNTQDENIKKSAFFLELNKEAEVKVIEPEKRKSSKMSSFLYKNEGGIKKSKSEEISEFKDTNKGGTEIGKVIEENKENEKEKDEDKGEFSIF